ncbi:MAG: PAS domain-containing protein [Marinosulfonomonas sp.]
MLNGKSTKPNVVSLDFRNENNLFPAFMQVQAYWTALAEGGTIPLRRDIDPRGIEDCLEYAFILERIAPGVARFRVAGRHMSDLMGLDVHGMPLSAMFEPAARQGLGDLVEATCAQFNCVTAKLDAPGQIGRAPLSARMFMAPLKSDLGRVDRILGCLQSQGRIGRHPRRFTISGVNTTLCDDFLVPVKGETLQVQHVEPVPPQTTKPGAKGPALRLVSNNG